MQKIVFKFSIVLVFSILLSSCTKDVKVGSKERPFQMFFVPSEDTEKISQSAGKIKNYVEKAVSQKLYQKDTGFHVKAAIPTSFIAVVEAFGTGRADFAGINTFAYFLLKEVKDYPVEAVLNVVRGVDEYSYKGQIIAHVDSGINSLEDLKGKKFAYSDPASTSGYVLPSQLFKRKGIELGETVFAMKHDNVVTMVYQGQVDAGATYHSPPKIVEKDGKKVEVIRDARARVKTRFPDVAKKVKIVGFTQEIPNAPWVIRTNIYPNQPEFYEKVKTAVRDSLLEYAKTEEGKVALDELYSITGLVAATDEDFGDVRALLKSSNLDVESVLMKKK